MDSQKQKKDSVFSGIFPANEPPLPPPPVHAPARPAVSEEQVATINKKLELMEKKLSEQPPAAPAEQTGAGAAVLSKIAEMEARMKDFQEKFLLGAAQIKNIEESKISARREIEELLKVVREQQKYSELDRQMHDQLEKAWGRVEDMEKRLMDFYGTISKTPPQPAPAAELPPEVYKLAEAALEERLKPLESALKEIAAKLEAAPGVSFGVEARVRELSAAVDARLGGFASEIRQVHVTSFAGAERVEGILAEVKKDVLSSVREAFSEGSGAFIKHVDAAALDGRERMDAFSKLAVNHIDALSAVCRATDSKLDALGSLIKSESERTRDEFGKTLRAGIEAAAADARAENARQLEKIKEIYGLSASGVAAMSAVSGNISGIEERLGGLSAGLNAFLKGLAAVNMDAILGVSGALIRKSFESVGELAAELEKETLQLAKAKGEIEANITRVNARPGTGEK